MFDTAPIRWLQSFDAESLVAFMRFVSLFGQQVFFVPLIIIVLFGIHQWKGLVLIETVLWTVILTTILKELLALPRPSDVDSLVRILDPGAMDQSPFGFPSGHCSLTIATWGTLALLFRKRWLLVPGIFFAILMPLSRMYLGRHFAGDVLGGTALGFLVIGVLFVAGSRLLAPLAAGAAPVPERGVVPGLASEPEPGPEPRFALVIAVIIYMTAGWVFKEAVQPALGLSAASVQVLREFVVTTSMVWTAPMAASLLLAREE